MSYPPAHCIKMIEKPKVDSPWSWLIALSTFVITGVTVGVTYSFGIFYVAILQEFPGKESEVAWIMSINLGMLMLWSPVTIYCCRRLTPRVVCCFGSLLGGLALYLASKSTNLGTLYVTFGLMHGIAGSFCYLSPILVLKTNFKKYLGLACGLSGSGIGAGAILFSSFLPSLMEAHGWRGALQICSYITFGTAMLCPIIIQRADQAIKVDSKPKEASFLQKKSFFKRIHPSVKSPWHNKAFIVLTIALLLSIFVSAIPYCHMVNFAIKQGLEKTNAGGLLVFLSLGSVIGKLFIGKLSGLCGMTRIFLVQVIFLISSVAITLSTLASSNALLIVICCVVGAMDGGLQVLIALVVDDVFLDKKQALKAFGHSFAIFSVPILLGSPTAGFLYRVTLSYHTVFYVCGAIYFIAACLMSIVQYLFPPSDSVSIPEKIVILPANNSRDGLSSHDTPYPDENRLIKSKTCSLLDLPVELHLSQTVNSIADGYSSLTDSKDMLLFVERVDRMNFLRQSQAHSGYHSGSKMAVSSFPDCCFYTDITEQISGVTEFGKKIETMTVPSSPESFPSTEHITGHDVACDDVTNHNVADEDNMDDKIMDIARVSSKEHVCEEDSLDQEVLPGVKVDEGYISSPSMAHNCDTDESCLSQSAADSVYGSLDEIPDMPSEEVIYEISRTEAPTGDKGHKNDTDVERNLCSIFDQEKSREKEIVRSTLNAKPGYLKEFV